MITPEIINYLLTLRYPGSLGGGAGLVCYLIVDQVVIPMIPPGTVINYAVRPLHGVFAHLEWGVMFGAEVVPNSFSFSFSQYGANPVGGIMTQKFLSETFHYFLLVTQQEPGLESITNLSPLTQRYEASVFVIIIPSSKDMETIADALRRLHTSTKSEILLQQATSLLGVLTSQPQEPQPSLGGS